MHDGTERTHSHPETAVADLGPGVVYAHARRGGRTLLVMNTDEHLATIPAARGLMQRPVAEVS